MIPNDKLPPGVTDADLRKDMHVCKTDVENARAINREDRAQEKYEDRQLWRDDE